MSVDLFDDYITAPEGPQPKNPHDFQFRSIDRGFFCVNCGQQMNKASPICSQRRNTK